MDSLVILPGWGGTQASWQAFIDRANRNYRVVCVELPCFGNEPCPSTVWGVEDYANFVKTKIEVLAKEGSRPIIFGHSFGGQVAAYLVGTNPGICAKLILSGAAIFRSKLSLRHIIFWPFAKIGKAIFALPGLKSQAGRWRHFLYRVARSPDYDATSGMKRAIFKKIIRQDFSALLGQINIPTLVVWGTHDSYVPLRSGRKIAAGVKGSKLEVISGGKHGLHLQDPEKLFFIVDKFITSG